MHPARSPTRRLLIVEPDRLTAWSLKLYFQKEYDIVQTDSVSGASDCIKSGCADVVLLSDNLLDPDLQDIDDQITHANPHALIVQMTTRSSDAVLEGDTRVTIEKPFELAALGRILRDRVS